MSLLLNFKIMLKDSLHQNVHQEQLNCSDLAVFDIGTADHFDVVISFIAIYKWI
jgi:hypothetical protein